jgi:anti-sigma B factor antagonist
VQCSPGVEVDAVNGVVRLTGDLDDRRAREVEAAATAALDYVDEELCIDTAGVTFADSAVLGALLAVDLRAVTRGKRVTFAPTSPAMHRLFVATGLISVLDVAAR